MDESRLIIRAQNGDKEAFQGLITAYYSYVSRFLLKLTGDDRISEDLTQDTFLRLIRGIEKYDVHGSASFSTYVMSIAKNLYIDYLRRNKLMVLSIDEENIQLEMHLEDDVLQQMQIQEVFKCWIPCLKNRLSPFV
ncbi:MAG: hypothetical protein CVU87_01015 [Firmicutes bacterium HGW-Firmicutes-12]|nr:MAG: hypothetical protein CVU87_01015 [Firmicutes bacterium HGW-Firmicutes-12]